MENNKNKKSVKFQGDMLNFCDFIQVFVFTRNHHLKDHSRLGSDVVGAWCFTLLFKSVTLKPFKVLSQNFVKI